MSNTAVRPLRILMAEDNEDHAMLMVDTLEDSNLYNNVTHVINGEQVLAYLRGEAPYSAKPDEMPDLILLDLKMPRLDGISTLKALKSDPELRHFPVVMVTTSSTDQEVHQCYDLGASGYISKPIEFDEFERKIRELSLYWARTSEVPPQSACQKR